MPIDPSALVPPGASGPDESQKTVDANPLEAQYARSGAGNYS